MSLRLVAGVSLSSSDRLTGTFAGTSMLPTLLSGELVLYEGKSGTSAPPSDTDAKTNCGVTRTTLKRDRNNSNTATRRRKLGAAVATGTFGHG
jgi:hypothetical protein